jgi:hypothetical protein
MGAFVFAAGVGLVYKLPFKNRLKIPDEHMVDYTVPKISRKNLAGFGLGDHETNRLSRTI